VDELRALGAGNIRRRSRAIAFAGDTRMMYRANLWLRTALRVVQPIASFQAADEQELYDGISAIDWSAFLSNDRTLAVDCALATDRFTHSKYVALLTKDAVVDQFRAASGRRPSVDTREPDVRIHVYIHGTQCIVSLDSSGDSLHRRGYRLDATEAPLNEVTAAALVLYSGWRGETAFLDPLCGSGTIAIEAALVAANRAPGLCGRTFGFVRWRDFDNRLWNELRAEARSLSRAPACEIVGADCDRRALAAARANAERAGVSGAISWREARFEQLRPPAERGVIVTNPPYGERLQPADLMGLYQQLRTVLAQRYLPAWRAWVLSANPQALELLGHDTAAERTLYNGKLECRVVPVQSSPDT
jgi:putative N6-adenine-specific DNA methylase